VKAGRLQPEVVDSFNTKCNEVEAAGEEPNRSLEGLLKFAKQVESGTQESGQGEGEGEGEAESEAQVETRTATILTFTYKTEAGNVSVRIDETGALKTNNNSDQIRAAIEFLNGVLTYNNL
jgi:hypothetical protein